jgi:hypothetical protein
VMPQYDAVVAITSGSRNMQSVMNLVWDRIVPALKSEALPADQAGATRLRERLAHLQLKRVAGAVNSELAKTIFGKRFSFPPNSQKFQSLSLQSDSDGNTVLALDYGAGEQRIVCGAKGWSNTQIPHGLLSQAFLNLPDTLVSANGAWTAPDTYRAKICFYQTPIYLTVQLKFAGDAVYVDNEYSVAFKEPKQPEVVGHAL